MHLELVADQRLGRQRHRLVEQRDVEIRHADVARHAGLLDLAQRAERFGQRHLRVRPVQQQEIDLGQPQLHQAVLGGAHELARRKMRRPDLGGDEHLVARHAGGAQPLAHLALVVVHLRGVDVAVAEPQRLLDHARAGASAQIPGAETDERDAGAFGFDGGGHRSRPSGPPHH